MYFASLPNRTTSNLHTSARDVFPLPFSPPPRNEIIRYGPETTEWEDVRVMGWRDEEGKKAEWGTIRYETAASCCCSWWWRCSYMYLAAAVATIAMERLLAGCSSAHSCYTTPTLMQLLLMLLLRGQWLNSITACVISKYIYRILLVNTNMYHAHIH